MTSNIGSRQLKDFGSGVGFNTNARQSRSDDNARSVIEGALKKSFSPEFLNRIDDVVIFDSLDREDIHKIIDLELVHLYKRISDLGYKLKLTDEAKDFIADKGFDPNFGARPLKRAIQKYLEDPLAEEIIKGTLAEGDTLEIAFDKEENVLKIVVVKVTVAAPAKAPKKKKEEKKDE